VCALLHEASYLAQQLAGVLGFDHHRIGSPTAKINFIKGIGRINDDCHFAVMMRHLPDQLHAVDIGKPGIDERQIEILLIEILQCPLTLFRMKDLKALKNKVYMCHNI
jgi:hypothetical protein